VRECELLGIEAIVGGCPLMFCGPVDVFHRCMRWWLQRGARPVDASGCPTCPRGGGLAGSPDTPRRAIIRCAIRSPRITHPGAARAALRDRRIEDLTLRHDTLVQPRQRFPASPDGGAISEPQGARHDVGDLHRERQ
jgi:hypothetical protein